MSSYRLICIFSLFLIPAICMADGLPVYVENCVEARKIHLADYKGENIPLLEDSKFFSKEYLKPRQVWGGKMSSPDGTFSLELTETVINIEDRHDCGDTAKYKVVFRDNKGNKKNVNDPSLCGDSLVEISPDSKYILLSGLQILDVKEWKMCHLLPRENLWYPGVQGWSKDGKKILVREYSSWIKPGWAREYIVEIFDK